jgi:hypothetical protein
MGACFVPDIADLASERETMDRELCLSMTTVAWLPFLGYCHNCDAPVPDGSRFCDADCRDDFQKREKACRA